MNNSLLSFDFQALSARCEALNALNVEINRLAPLYRELFSKYIGQKVTKADGSLLEKIKSNLPKSDFFAYCPHVGCFLFRIRYGKEGFGKHEEHYFYAFEIRNGRCEQIRSEFVPFKTDWNPVEVMKLRTELDLKQSEIRKIESELGVFRNWE